MIPRAAGVLVFLTLVTSAAALESSHPVALPDNPLRGRLLFETKSCGTCHNFGEGAPTIGPSLDQGRFNGTFLDLGAALWNHVPGMSARFEGSELVWPQLSADEASALLSFLYAIEYLGQPGNAEAGRRALVERGCVACHTVSGGGGGVGGDLARLHTFASPLLIAQAIWNHGPAMIAAMRRRNIPAPQLADGDIANIAAYLRQLASAGPQHQILLAPGNPNHGRELLTARRCTECHAVHGEGGGVGPDLGRASLRLPAESIAARMWNHAVTMNELMRERGLAWPELAPDELADLVAYLYFLPFADPTGEALRGATVFSTRSCAGCHAATGDAAHPGPDLASSTATESPAALVAAMWNHAPVMREAIVADGKPWPQLSGRDLRDLLAYLRSQQH